MPSYTLSNMSSDYYSDRMRLVAVETCPTHCPHGHSWKPRGSCRRLWDMAGGWLPREQRSIAPHMMWRCETPGCDGEVHHDGVTKASVVMRRCDIPRAFNLTNPNLNARPDRP